MGTLWRRLVGERVRERAFWAIQGMVAAATATHAVVEAFDLFSGEFGVATGLHHLPVLLYLIPVVYAGLRYGFEGAALTGAWSVLLSLPNMFLWHAESYLWVGDLLYVSGVVAVGLVVAVPVERDRRHQQRLAATTRRLELLKRQEEERLRSYVQGITKAQEEERRRIALELHDTTAQELVRLCRGLDALSGIDGDLRELAEQTLDGVRRLSRDLRPTILDDLGLVPALKWLANDVSSRGIATRCLVVGTVGRLPADTELALFRIAQEALRNVEKHADASEASVHVTFRGERVGVTVTDNGVGIQPVERPEQLVRSGRLGLAGMGERADLVGGRLTITARPEGGTTVAVEVDAGAVTRQN